MQTNVLILVKAIKQSQQHHNQGKRHFPIKTRCYQGAAVTSLVNKKKFQKQTLVDLTLVVNKGTKTTRRGKLVSSIGVGTIG